MKSKITAFLSVLALSAAFVMAGAITVITHSGDPNGTIAADAGQVCSDTAAGVLWVKTGTTAKNGWVAYNSLALGNALRGTITLTSGAGSVTNAAITTNSRAIVTATGTTAAGHLGTTINTGTLAVQSTSNTDARTVTYLIFNP